MKAPIHSSIAPKAARWALLVFAMLLQTPSRPIRADEPRPAPDLAYQASRLDPIDYELDYSVVVTAPAHTKQLRVWLPLPQSDVGQEIEPGLLTTFPLEVQPQVSTEKVFGNRFAYFEFDHPLGAQVIRHQFKVRVWELRWAIEPQKLMPITDWPAGFDPYLKGDDTVVVNDDVLSLARGIIRDRPRAPQGTGDLHSVAALMEWVNANLKYDHAAASLRASSQHALTERAGHCSDYHGLCAALGRALGQPTRVTYGLNLFPKSSPSHCKLEAYLHPYGWVSFDVSETQKLMATIDKQKDLSPDEKARLRHAAQLRLATGFRDNTWLLQTRGTDYHLAPPASRRVAVVRTIYAEADGEPLPDPDPANPNQREFAWMTALKISPSQPAPYPFQDWRTLQAPTRQERP